MLFINFHRLIPTTLIAVFVDTASGGDARQPRGGGHAAPGAQAERQRRGHGRLHGPVDRLPRGLPRDRQCPAQHRCLHQHPGQVRRHESDTRGQGRPQGRRRVPAQEVRRRRHTGQGTRQTICFLFSY